MNKTSAKKTTIVLAADHAGFALKEAVKSFLGGPLFAEKYDVLDVGAHELVEGDDYPVYMSAAAMHVAADAKAVTKAIIFGKSGQGEAIVANRFPGVRAIVWYGPANGHAAGAANSADDIIRLSREHNNANVLSIGAGFVTEAAACKAVELWLGTAFSEDPRHERRIMEIDSIE